jgi:hypothetical protein
MGQLLGKVGSYHEEEKVRLIKKEGRKGRKKKKKN